MFNTYNVTDLSGIYDMPDDNMFLILCDDKQSIRNTKRIQVWENRFLDLKYEKNEMVRVLIRNKDTKAFDVFEIPERDGVYDINGALLARGIQLKWDVGTRSGKNWGVFKRNIYASSDRVTISDNAMIVGQNGNRCDYGIVLHNPILVEGTKIHFYHAAFDKTACLAEIKFVNKCLCGELITYSDFFELLDNGGCCEYVFLNFGSVYFYFERNKTIRIKKILDEKNPESENIVFKFKLERVIFPSMLLSIVLQAESEDRLLESIAKYYV